MEKLTERARRVLSLASAAAVELHHAYLGSEHLLIGLIREGSGVAVKALEELGLEADAILGEIARAVEPGSADDPSGELPMTPRAHRALRSAWEQAQQMGQDFVGTEHILLGLLADPEGLAGQVLNGLGVDFDQVASRIQELFGGSLPQAQDSDESDLPKLPPMDAEPGEAPALAAEDQLCLDALGEVPGLKALTLAAGGVLDQKLAAVGEENFERAAELRDALARLNEIVAEAQQRWEGEAGGQKDA